MTYTFDEIPNFELDSFRVDTQIDVVDTELDKLYDLLDDLGSQVRYVRDIYYKMDCESLRTCMTDCRQQIKDDTAIVKGMEKRLLKLKEDIDYILQSYDEVKKYTKEVLKAYEDKKEEFLLEPIID